MSDIAIVAVIVLSFASGIAVGAFTSWYRLHRMVERLDLDLQRIVEQYRDQVAEFYRYKKYDKEGQ